MNDLTRRQLEMERRVYRLEDLADKELARSNAAMMAAQYLGNVLTLEWAYTGIAVPVCYRIYGPTVNTAPGSILVDCQQNATLLSGACDEYPGAPYYSAISFECFNTQLNEWVWVCRCDWSYPATDFFGNTICSGRFVWTYASVVDGATATSQGVPAMPAPYSGYRYQVTLAPTRRVGYAVNAIFVNGQIRSGMYDGAAASNSIDSANGTITGINCFGGSYGDTTGTITAAAAPVKSWPPIPYPKSVTVTIVAVAATAAALNPGQTNRNQIANADAATIWNQIGGIISGYSDTRATNSGPVAGGLCNGGYMGSFPFDSTTTKIGTFTPTFMGAGRCAVDVFGGRAGVQTSQNTQPLIGTEAIHMSGSLSKCLGAITSADPEARLYVGNTITNPSFSIGLSSATAAGCDPSKFPNPDRTVSLGAFGSISGFGGNIARTTAVEGDPIDKEWTVTANRSVGVSGDNYDEVDPQTGQIIQGVCNLSVTLKVKINCGI
jgi:hypothetical protein